MVCIRSETSSFDHVCRCASFQSRSNYRRKLKRISKVLDFVQFGGRNATELRTFEWELAF